jgi:hypothetical protein
MKPSQAIEAVKPCDDPSSSDLLLCGIDDIQRASIEFSEAVYYKHITEDNTVSNAIGLGPNNKFFYRLVCYQNNVIVGHETGIGYAYEVEGKHYFKRDLPLVHGKNEKHLQVITNNCLRFHFPPDSTSILSSDIPPNLSLLFHTKNCVLASRDQFAPSALEILDNCVLTSMHGELTNLAFDSKTFSDIIAEALNKYTKQLVLKTSKLSVNKLSVKHLQLDSSSDLNVKKGTFIYDETTDTVKFYNGSKWRTLKWAEDESE